MQPLRRPALIAPLLAGLSMFGPFAIDMMFPAFAQMQAQFKVDAVVIQQTLSVYMLAYALMSVVHGPLSDALGRRRVILAGLVMFAAASVGCALAPDLHTLLMFRALQGISAGAGMIVGRAVIRDLYQGADAQRLMSQVSMIFGIAPAIAPIVGGWLLGVGRWPLIFWALTGFSVVLLVATLVALPETLPQSARQPLAPCAWLRNYLHIASSRRFRRLALASGLLFGGIFVFISSAPVVIIRFLGLGEQDFGWLFIPTIGGMILGAFLSGRLAGRVEGVRQCRIGFTCCGLGVLAMVGYAALSSRYEVPWAMLPLLLCGLGMALVFPILSLAILDMYPDQRGAASSMQAFIQLLIGTLVAGVLSPLFSRSPAWLSLGAAACFFLGWLLWRIEVWAGQRIPNPTETDEINEPTDAL